MSDEDEDEGDVQWDIDERNPSCEFLVVSRGKEELHRKPLSEVLDSLLALHGKWVDGMVMDPESAEDGAHLLHRFRADLGGVLEGE